MTSSGEECSSSFQKVKFDLVLIFAENALKIYKI